MRSRRFSTTAHVHCSVGATVGDFVDVVAELFESAVAGLGVGDSVLGVAGLPVLQHLRRVRQR